MRVGILGANGMLGWMVDETFKHSFNVVPFTRKELTVSTRDVGLNPETYSNLQYCDFIINCIGAIKPAFSDHKRLAENIVVNSVFPRVMADFCEHNNIGFIHITTDCVFDGLDGYYTENSKHNALDDYGRTKSLGEPDNCMVIRTSIIGPEKDTKKSLVEWLVSNNGKGVKGFTNHMWNGLTTLELANVMCYIIRRGMYARGKYHIFSEDVTKLELLESMVVAWGLDISIEAVAAPEYCNRTLRTVKELNSIVAPRQLRDMLQDIKPYVKI